MAVECDRALNREDQEISISDANSGANGYFCLGCRRELLARKGKRNDPHFAHLATNKATGEKQCNYSSETYRHNKAKEILLRLKSVRVPAVYAAYPSNYEGQVPRLAKACNVIAVTVLAEHNVYLNEVGSIKWGPKNKDEPFDDQGGKWEPLVRPDIIFLDATNKPILFIELAATHFASEKKLARLHLLKIDTIEVSIPKSFEPEKIESLFSVTSNTQWLYNAQRAAYRFDPAAARTSADGSIGTSDLGGGIYEQGETIRCRRSRLENALRHLKKCMGRPEIIADQQAVSAAQERGEELAAELETQRRGRIERLGAAVREGMEAHRQEGSEHEREFQRKEKRLLTVVTYAMERIERAKAQWRDSHHRAEGEIREGQNQLEQERRARQHEQQRLAGIRKELDGLAKQLDDEEAGFATEESSLAIAEATTRRNLDLITGQISRIDEEAKGLEG